MANNRMFLVHKPSGKAILLAKYYPNTGWYCFHPQERYDEFFDETKEDEIGTLFGDTDYELRFETDEERGKVLRGDEKFPFSRKLNPTQVRGDI